jgi:hypothetical protein
MDMVTIASQLLGFSLFDRGCHRDQAAALTPVNFVGVSRHPECPF